MIMAGSTHRTFGSLRRLPSGRWQAAYTGPDKERYRAPGTFATKGAADKWLAKESVRFSDLDWTPPGALAAGAAEVAKPVLFGEYSAVWLAGRTLKPRTRELYAGLLSGPLADFLPVPVKDIDVVAVRAWHARMGTATPTRRAHAYSLLGSVLKDAVIDGLLPMNPAVIRGAGVSRKKHVTKMATPDELVVIINEMPERYTAMVLLATWCAMRFGELIELRRSDVDFREGVIRIERGAVRCEGEVIIGDPKSEAGKRTVAIPPHIVPALKKHLADHVRFGKDALLFPAVDGHSTLAPSTFYGSYYPARNAAGRPDLRFHDLRHTGAVLAARTGATLAELMGRLGHSTPSAAMRYQSIAKGRDAEIAEAMSKMAAGR